MADLNDLLARLKMPVSSNPPTGSATANGNATPIHRPQPQPSNYHQPYVSSPITSPPFATPQPQSLMPKPPGFAPNGMNIVSQDRAGSDRTASLLNLLKFNQSSGGSDIFNQGPQGSRDRTSRAVSASPFLAAPSSLSSVVRQGSLDQLSALAGSEPSSRPPAVGKPQDVLLQLLNRSQPTGTMIREVPIALAADTVESEDVVPSIEARSKEREATPVRVFGAEEEPGSTFFQPPRQVSNGSLFTYVNPFEQLAASSPRIATPALDSEKVATAAHAARSAAPSPLPDGRTQVEALLGIGADKKSSETVTQALDGISDQVEKEARNAVARAEGESAANDSSMGKEDTLSTKELREAVHEAAVELNDELKTADGRAAIEKGMPRAMAKAFEDTINEVAQETVADSWESADADGSSTMDDNDPGVRVLNFPIRPFVSIDVLNLPTPASALRQEIVMKIASLKKEFDQVDRTLASATTKLIVYAIAKGGGLRIISQDDGNNKQVFRKAENQIFNVSISAPASHLTSTLSESILATGVNGSVYWTSIPISSPAAFDDEDLDKQGFIFPPLTTAEENTSGAQLKTRAKQSSRHPEFFAVGRGKSIHVIWPALAMSSPYLNEKTRVVDTEKYLSERCLKITMGKAGKDFTFSEDDSILVSLDKAGRVKFWDIREHSNPATAAHPEAYRHVESKIPLMVIPTSAPTEKSWATSVLLVDKEKPVAKGAALRYLLVGSKQNHTLQLWDLGLGKPVQEINFPHENETDAICSIAYHAKSGIIVIGHPTRNSIFLINLSIPRYNLPGISQADYISKLAEGSAQLPAPELTAIMSGMRELSLSSIGQLRSLSISDPLASLAEKIEQDETTVFDVYVMHSRGVTCLNLKRKDFGWDVNGKVLIPVDAEAEKIIEVKALSTDWVAEAAEPSETGTKSVDTPAKAESIQAPKSDAKKSTKDHQSPIPELKTSPKEGIDAASKPVLTKQPRKAAETKAVNAATKTSDTIPSAEKVAPKSIEVPPVVPSTSLDAKQATLAVAATTAKALSASVERPAQYTSGPIDSEMLGHSINKAISNTFSNVLGQVLGDQIEHLYSRLDNDKRVQEAAGAAKQDAVLRLVSSTLGDNVEKNLSRIILSQIEQKVLPALCSTTTTTLNGLVSKSIDQQLQVAIPREMKSALEPSIRKAVQNPETMSFIANSVGSKIAGHVEAVFSAAVSSTILPAFHKLAIDTARKSTAEVERRVAEQLREVTIERQVDSAKLDQLTALTSQLLETVHTMAKTVSESQLELMKLQAQFSEREALQAITSVEAPEAPSDEELDLVAQLMTEGRYEEATMRWLQSPRRVDLFDLFFIGQNPSYLRQVDRLITLSVSAAVTDSLDTNLEERLAWLEVAFGALDPNEPVVAENAGQVMEVLIQRLSDAFMAYAEEDPAHPLLGKIRQVVGWAKRIKAASA